MKAVVCKNNELSVQAIPEPIPEEGQVVVEILRNGICGSDLHVRQSTSHMKSLMDKVGDGKNFPDSQDAIVFGHEFCAEIVEFGPKCKKKLKTGTRIVAPPLLNNNGMDVPGLSKSASGAYAERMLLQEFALIPVPNGLSSEMAALTEPMAVGLHAVNRSEIKPHDVAIVIGCGPIGLAVITALKAKGINTIIASDFSAGRRAFAKQSGADILIDPASESPFNDLEKRGYFKNLTHLGEYGLDLIEKANYLPFSWWSAAAIGEKIGLGPKGPVIFECVGVPGIIQQLIESAPIMSRIIGVGLCMETDQFEPAIALTKEIDIRFVNGWTPTEFKKSLHLIANGKLTCKHLITGTVGLDGVANAFDELKDPEKHAKIMIDPKSSVIIPTSINH